MFRKAFRARIFTVGTRIVVAHWKAVIAPSGRRTKFDAESDGFDEIPSEYGHVYYLKIVLIPTHTALPDRIHKRLDRESYRRLREDIDRGRRQSTDCGR